MAKLKRDEALLKSAQEDGLISQIMPLEAITSLALKQTADLETVKKDCATRRVEADGQIALAELLEDLGDAPRNADLAESVLRGTPPSLIESVLQSGRSFSDYASDLRNRSLETGPALKCLTDYETSLQDIATARRAGLAVTLGHEAEIDTNSPAVAVDIAKFVLPAWRCFGRRNDANRPRSGYPSLRAQCCSPGPWSGL